MCTTAERAYALEAWRVLDVNNNLILPEHRRKRIVCVNSRTKKCVAAVVQPALKSTNDTAGERCGGRCACRCPAGHLLPAIAACCVQDS